MLLHHVPRLGRDLSAIGLGTWQLGADWGAVTSEDATAVLATSLDAGVTLFDTADVYGDGRSERLIGAFLAGQPDVGRPDVRQPRVGRPDVRQSRVGQSDAGRPDIRQPNVRHPDHDVLVATKMGRRAPQVPESYTPASFRAWTERSRANLGVDTLDLIQLHCPPTEVITDPATYAALDEFVADGTVAAYGVSVETCDQALAAIDHGVASIQIILNPFRLKPLERVLPAARAAGVGVLARVPLASGLLSGRYTESTTFPASDHRTYNRDGTAFDQGETFSGVDYAVGLMAARELAQALPDGVGLPAATLAWIASLDGVTSAIPGARNAAQARANADAAALLESGWDVAAFDAAVHRTYDAHLRSAVHPRW